MEIFYSIALLVVAAVIANIVYTEWPVVPLAFYQIGSGLLLSLLPIFHHYTLYPEMFMLVIIAPLLFNDGQQTNLKRLSRSVGQIISLSVFLALVTAIGVGLFTKQIYTALPLALAFALAAIITPTDSVALSSITSGLQVPDHLDAALENESLFNDASGIVIFNLALVAFTTGNFSIANGIKNFAVSFLGGLLIGLVFGFLFTHIQSWFISQSMDTTSVVVPFSIMTPFAIYLIAEIMGSSGILAAVAAGIVFGISQNRLKLTSTNVQIVASATWQIIINLLNGFVFVLMGVTLPTVLSQMSGYSWQRISGLALLGVGIYLVMFICRFIWARLGWAQLMPEDDSPQSNSLQKKLASNHQQQRRQRHQPSSIKDSFIIAVSGIHGTITLSMALSIPLAVDGVAFPFRNDIIFLAAVVILLSLLAPSLILPQILPAVAKVDKETIAQYRAEMVDYSVNQLKNNSTAPLVDRDYVIDTLVTQKNQQADRAEVNKILKQTVKVAQDTLNNLSDTNQITGRVANITASRDSRMTQRSFSNYFRFLWRRYSPANRKQRRHFREKKKNFQQFVQSDDGQQKIQTMTQQLATAENAIFKNVINYLDEISTKQNAAAVAYVRRFYNVRHNRITNSVADNDQRTKLFIQALQSEYSYVANLYGQHKISKQQADELNQSISSDQLVYMQSISD